jgi:hypothetical protein
MSYAENRLVAGEYGTSRTGTGTVNDSTLRALDTIGAILAIVILLAPLAAVTLFAH